MTDLTYFNGEFLPLNEVKISPLDRGFLFADGVYEVIPVYNRRPFFLKEHLNRLYNSLRKIELKIGIEKNEIKKHVLHLIEKSSYLDQIVYIQITRGVAPRNHAFPKNIKPTIFIMSSQLIRPSEKNILNGISAITIEDKRWKSCDIKSVSLLSNVLAREKAITMNCHESILVNKENVTEGAASTIWIVNEATVFCPKPGGNLLEGIRIQIIEKLCANLGIKFSRNNFKVKELMSADEVLLTSATKEILAITSINGEKIGQKTTLGKPGSIFKKLRKAYTDLMVSE